MPTSISTRPPGSPNPTRQQLDELDALLQRMLEVPVKPIEEGNEIEAEAEADALPPPAPARPVTKVPSYTVVETATPRTLPAASGFEPQESPLIERTPEAAEPEAEAWVPLRSTWQPSAQTWQPLAESWRQANETPAPPAAVESDPPPQDDPSPPAPESLAFVPQAAPPDVAEAPPVEPLLSLTADDAPEALSPPLLPLLWFNQGFDACMTPWGAAGRWLCSPIGRQTLGLAGLAFLAAAVVVAVSAGMTWPW